MLLIGLTPAQALDAGAVAPGFILPTRDGVPVSLQSLRGHYVYVDFWASWCAPCRQSFPWMDQLQARHAARGLKVLAINIDTDAVAAHQFLDQAAPAFTVLFNGSAYTPGNYEVDTMPTAFLIDPAGKVVLVRRSFRRSEAEELARRIAVALGDVEVAATAGSSASR
ncbi:TlpA disulfide reductase family protein [Nevskia sp.]|uniref:TlpA family protein disulfide reductase n=1 Tax=Nevskia sp. TaxID=1929292 RepID=UPI0025ED0F74|nr:TlpA disulfide reductase family protein [Nevskia sp.]